MFAIIALYIHPECEENLRKVLLHGLYCFNQNYTMVNGELRVKNEERRKFDERLWGSRISVAAIVGKNGSGKSSIIDLVVASMNNLSFWIFKDFNRPSAERLYLIHGLHVDLHYVLNDKEGVVQCRDTSVKLFYDHSEVFSADRQDGISYGMGRNALTHTLFYTILTNYSVQAYNSMDYSSVVDFKENGTIVTGKRAWVNGLFHKNDGYTTPIVLNPYRNDGILDINNEFFLTNSRLIGLMQYLSRSRRRLIDGYDLDYVRYQYDATWMKNKLSEHGVTAEQYDASRNIYLSQGSILHCILSRLLPEGFAIDNEIQWQHCLYLAYKTLLVVSKYPMFEKQRSICHAVFDDNEWILSERPTNQRTISALNEMVDAVKSDNSHITLKIRQTLRILPHLANEGFNFHEFKLDEYIALIRQPEEIIRSVDSCFELLPPPLFTGSVYFRRGRTHDIPFNKFSAGERQLIYTITTIVYHMRNLLSVRKDRRRVCYRNINIILDEIEICFHPEFQRQFLNYLIETLNRLQFTRFMHINIIIATHSPFILSDIPKSNILYLKDGEVAGEAGDFINPFGANVNDILHQSFFLEHGFAGDYVRKQVHNVVSRLTVPEPLSPEDDKYIRFFIEEFGEPFIKLQMQHLYSQHTNG